MPQGLTRNAARCKKCGDTLESKHRHDFVTCSCGAISIDGGLEYSKWRCNLENIEDLSEYGDRPEPGPTAWDLAEREIQRRLWLAFALGKNK